MAWVRFSRLPLLLTHYLLLFRPSLQEALQCMCGNTMSVPLLTDAATVSGAERETAAVRPQQAVGGAVWETWRRQYEKDLA